MSVPLQTVPDGAEGEDEASSSDRSVAQANHEATEILAQARKQAEAIVTAARASQPATTPSPLAALGDNADEIIGEVHKLIKKQRELQTERQVMADEISQLKIERDDLVQRLTDAVVRMEELAAIAENAPAAPTGSPNPQNPPRETTSLSARLEQAERDRREEDARADEDQPDAPNPLAQVEVHQDAPQYVVQDDDQSFYSRHSAKLPRLEGDGGRSILSAVGGMRPELEPKGRIGRRGRKKD